MSQPKDYDPNATDHWIGDIRAVSGKGRDGWLQGLVFAWLQGLVLAGIIALVGIVWNLRNEVTKIGTFLTAKVEQYDRDIARIDRTLERHDNRITVIERGHGTDHRQPDNR